MKVTVFLIILLTCALFGLLYFAFKLSSKHRKLLYAIVFVDILSIITLFLTQGTTKINSNHSRIIKNSKPKSAEEVYSLLFNQPIDTCITFIHFKDQVIPKIDCCIWMELNVCPKEFLRIITLKKYQETILTRSNSAIFSSTLFRPASLVETTKPWRQPYKAEYRF